MAHDHEQTLRAFIQEWSKGFDAVAAAFRRYLAPNAVWEQPPIPTTRSLDEALALLHDFKEKIDLLDFPADIRQLAVTGDVAFAERVDRLRRSDGSVIGSIPVIGVFEFNREGKIAAWREYFDSAPVLKMMEDIGKH